MTFAYLWLVVCCRCKQVLYLTLDVLAGRISYYPKSVRRLEEKFAKLTGSEFGLMCTNATSAMEAALFSLGVNHNSKVLTVGYVIPSSYSPAHSLGAELSFIDIDEQTLNVNIDNLVSMKGNDIDVLIVVHFYGNPCDMQTIMRWAESNNVSVIEDCSHCHGASFNGKMLGSWGDVGVFSLQGDKAVAAGEGAIAVTDRRELFIKMAAYSQQKNYREFISEDENEQNMPPFGYGRKMRAHPLGATLALVDLDRLNQKNKIFEHWFLELEKISKGKTFRLQHKLPGAVRGGYAMGIVILFENSEMANNFKDAAKTNRIGFFQREYAESIKYFKNNRDIPDLELERQLPVTIECFQRAVFVPFYQFIDFRRFSRLKRILGTCK